MAIAEERGLRAVLTAVNEGQAVANTTPQVDNFAPLTERAPVQMPEIVRQQYGIAAKSLEDAADALQAEMQSVVTLIREEASSLRSLGESQANTIEASSIVIRDAHRVFKAEFDKLARFRVGLAAAPDLDLIQGRKATS